MDYDDLVRTVRSLSVLRPHTRLHGVYLCGPGARLRPQCGYQRGVAFCASWLVIFALLSLQCGASLRSIRERSYANVCGFLCVRMCARE